MTPPGSTLAVLIEHLEYITTSFLNLKKRPSLAKTVSTYQSSLLKCCTNSSLGILYKDHDHPYDKAQGHGGNSQESII